MTDNVIKIKEAPSVLGVESTSYSVFCEGRRIPKMRAKDHGEHIEIILDGRFSYTFPKEIAYDAVNFAAQAMAIGAGYPWLGAETKDRPFAPQVMAIEISK